MTNGDKIRSMTDDELAELLHNAGGNWYTEEYLRSWLKKKYESCDNCAHLTDEEGLPVCELDDRVKDDEMTCERFAEIV